MNVEQLTAELQGTKSPSKLRLSDGDVLAMVYLTDFNTNKRTPVSEELARRLLACWNLNVGTSTADLEAAALAWQEQRNRLAAYEACLAG